MRPGIRGPGIFSPSNRPRPDKANEDLKRLLKKLRSELETLRKDNAELREKVDRLEDDLEAVYDQ